MLIGFLSIDCGYTERPSYTDDKTGITYVADVGFTDAGVIHPVYPENMQPDLADRYKNIRYFPNGTRNCYTMRSLPPPPAKYMVRAIFGYGNYDTLNRLPVFDLYLGPNYWTTVTIVNSSTAYIHETISVSSADYLQVCLVNRGLGTPFIAGLDVRLLKPSLYPDSTWTQSLVLLSFFRPDVGFGPNRYHFGTDYRHIRFPDDPYDRIWQRYEQVPGWTVVPDAINGDVKTAPNDTYGAPSAVMRSVSTLVNSSATMGLYWSLDGSMSGASSSDKYLLALYFAEVEALQQGEFRQFDVLLDNFTLASGFRPQQMTATVLSAIAVQGAGSHAVYLVPALNSKPPLISAMEVFLVRPLNESATDSGDGMYI